MHYTNPHDAALAQQSLPYFRDWSDLVGAGDPGISPDRGRSPRAAPLRRASCAPTSRCCKAVGVNTGVISPRRAARDRPRRAHRRHHLRRLGARLRVRRSGGDRLRLRRGRPRPRRRASMRGRSDRDRDRRRARHRGRRRRCGRIATDTVVVAPGAWRQRTAARRSASTTACRPNRVQIVDHAPHGRPTAHPHPVYIDGSEQHLAASGRRVRHALRHRPRPTRRRSRPLRRGRRLRLHRRFPQRAAPRAGRRWRNAFMRGGWAGRHHR